MSSWSTLGQDRLKRCLRPHHQHAVQPREVLADFDLRLREARPRQGEGGLALLLADLGEEGAAGLQVGRGVAQQPLDEAEAVGAAVQAEAGLVLADLRGRGLEVGAADVGEVGGDDVDLRGERRQEVALAEVDALRDAVAFGVAAGEGERVRRDIDGDDRRPAAGSRASDTAMAPQPTPTSAIAKPVARSSRSAEREHQLHERLGLRPGDDGGGRDLELQAEELLAAGDVGDGLVGEAAAQEGVEGGGGVRREVVREPLVEVGAVGAEGVGEEELRLQGGLVAAGSASAAVARWRASRSGHGIARARPSTRRLCRRAPHGSTRRLQALMAAQASCASRRRDCSSACIASMMSSMSPSRRAGRLWRV